MIYWYFMSHLMNYQHSTAWFWKLITIFHLTQFGRWQIKVYFGFWLLILISKFTIVLSFINLWITRCKVLLKVWIIFIINNEQLWTKETKKLPYYILLESEIYNKISIQNIINFWLSIKILISEFFFLIFKITLSLHICCVYCIILLIYIIQCLQKVT